MAHRLGALHHASTSRWSAIPAEGAGAWCPHADVIIEDIRRGASHDDHIAGCLAEALEAVEWRTCL